MPNGYGKSPTKTPLIISRPQESDHNPLETIFLKPLTAAPKCLQGMLLYLQKLDLAVCYKKGTEMFLVDTLSRAPLPEVFSARNRLRSEKDVS